MSNTLYVDRVEASKILKVSTRTIDRYLRRYRFKTRKDGRKVLIKRGDVDTIIRDHIGRMVDITDDSFNSIIHQEAKPAETQLTVKDFKVKKIRKESKESIEAPQEGEVFKDLYLEAKKEISEKQERLEAATYRVGQLESQIKSMVPMLEFNKKDKQLKEAHLLIEQRTKQSEETVRILEGKLRSERVAKWVYLSLVGTLLVAEPILFVMWAFA
jgi:hypothetical protein